MCMLPYGVSDYKLLKENHYVYVDKSMYIEKMEQTKRYIHFLRPRRFGKSLFTSMLGCYYDIAMKNEFDLLFQDTYIHEHPTKEKNAYYVLNINFSGFTGKHGKELELEFDDKVMKALQNFIARYDFPIDVSSNKSAARMLGGFISDMQPLLQEHKIYVIIDEYDHFANDLLSFHFDEFNTVMGSNGFVRAFYEELKIGTQMGIGRIFMTGVSPISLDSMTSGYNISTNLSLDPRYNEMMGFTTEEMKHLISLVDGIKNKEDTLYEMKQYYDGYQFSKQSQHHVYNPNMSLYFLDAYQTTGTEPEEIVDRNIFSDYAKLEQLLYIKTEENHIGEVQQILDGVRPEVEIIQQFTLSTRFSDQDFYSLLFYLGYLTIDQADDFSLTMKIPNMVMKKVFIEYFQTMIERELEFHADISGWRKAIVAFLKENDSDLYVKEIETILHKYPDRMYRNFKERNVQQIGEMIVGAITGVDSDLEYGNDEGYCDQVIIPANAKYPRKLIEYKYLKKDYSQHELNKAIEDAKKQAEAYLSSRQLKRYPMDAWIMVFAKDTCVYRKEIAKE